jgi:hypothetical protein
MTCPFGLDTIMLSQRFHDDRDCHHAPPGAHEKAPRCGGASVEGAAVAAGQLTRVQVWPPQNMPPKAQP